MKAPFALRVCTAALLLLSATVGMAQSKESPMKLNLRSQEKAGDGKFKVVEKKVEWAPKETALIIVDMWDAHWCKSAAARVVELAGPMNAMIQQARSKGVFIIHSPSSVVDFYKDTPQRKRALAAPFARTKSPLSTADRWGTKWVWPDSSREGDLPIDDSDMGCDCAVKCTIREAWTRQISTIEIAEQDAITDIGQEAFNLLAERGIKNVMIAGVHLNMCVLGRPVAIRQMVQQGKNIALIRDMTDTMYNPEKKPFGSHFKGTELVVDHVEKYWCPTFLSSDLTGGKAFGFLKNGGSRK
jgi:nicotinamidase-related amidase